MIESLETRIAPASVVVTYTDLDGDLVKITASKTGAVAPPLDAADLTFTDGTPDGQLRILNLIEAGFDGASIVFTVTKKPGGDGLAHVGYINATGVDLNKVTVKGDLGKIVAGDTTTANDPGVNLLQARTMGTLGLFTQGGMGDLDSTITGKLGALKVTGDFTNAFLRATAATQADGEIGSIFIGGDITGGSGNNSGRVSSSGAMGNVRIAGDLTGGAGNSSGQIFSAGAMGDVRIGGDLTGAGFESGVVYSVGAMGDVRIGGNVTGGASSFSGRIVCIGVMGDVRIGGDIIGGAGGNSGEVSSVGAMGDVQIGGDVSNGTSLLGGLVNSGGAMGDVRIGGDFTGGRISSGGAMGDVRIGGNLTGGATSSSGRVYSVGAMGNVRIGGDLVGGSAASGTLSDSGQVRSDGRIASVTIGGSLIAGFDTDTGTLTRCGAILAGDDLGPVKIGGSILGNSSHAAVITARGQDVPPTTGFDTTIARLSVGGDVRFARILGGFNIDQLPANADASIGKVAVGGNWEASSLVAGAQDTGLSGFGEGDTPQAGGQLALIARIASITIKGGVIGSLAAGDHFGFVAEQIDKLKIGARTFTLTPGPSSLTENILIPFTDDVRLLEVGFA